MSKISVVVPLYNKEAYISRAIDSVLAQTFQDFELIVVDDGSTDSSPELIKKYQDPRVKLVQQPNMGPGAARNRGIEDSTAPYITFLDADDEWLPNFLNRYLLALTENPECDYVVGPRLEGSDRVDKSDEWRHLGVIEAAWSLPLNASAVDLHRFLTVLHFTCAMMCTRCVVERYGGFYSENGCRYGEDRYLQMQLLLNHNLFRLIDPLVWYHTETHGISALGSALRPLIPILSDPEPIRESCQDTFRSVLEEYLVSHAIGYAMGYARAGELTKSKDLIHRFPAMRKKKYKFAKLIGMMAFSKLSFLKVFKETKNNRAFD